MLKEIVKEARENNKLQRNINECTLSLIGERYYQLSNYEKEVLVKNALWFISDRMADEFVDYLNDYEEDFMKENWEGE